MNLIFLTNLTKSKIDKGCLNVIEKVISIDKLDEAEIIVNEKTYKELSDFIKNKKYQTKISLITANKNATRNLVELVNDIIVSNKIKDDLIIVSEYKLLSLDLNKVKRYFDAIKKPIIILYKSNNKNLVKKSGEYYLDEDGFVKSFRERISTIKSGLVSAGAFIFPKDSLFWFGKFLKSGSDKLNFGNLIKKIAQKRKVRGIVENEIIEM